MPIPFIIGGIVAAVATAAVVALKDNNSNSGSGGDDDDKDDAAERAREKAAADRRKLDRANQLTASLIEFSRRGSQFGESIMLALPSDLIHVSSSSTDYKLDFDLKSTPAQPSQFLFHLAYPSSGGTEGAWPFPTATSFLQNTVLKPSLNDFREAIAANPALAQITQRIDKLQGTKSGSFTSTLGNLAAFAKFFPVVVEPGSKLHHMEDQMQELDADLKRAKKLRQEILELEAELASASKTGATKK